MKLASLVLLVVERERERDGVGFTSAKMVSAAVSVSDKRSAVRFTSPVEHVAPSGTGAAEPPLFPWLSGDESARDVECHIGN